MGATTPMSSETLCYIKETRHKGDILYRPTYTKYLEQILRTESQTVVARGWRQGQMGS